LKAPTEKSNDIVQICVTRKCTLFNCSNCTQLLPFRQDAIEMSVDVFRLALRSLEGWPGVRAMFGGNPPNHSRFPDLCQIMVEEVPNPRQRGLWANDLLSHGALVRDVFQFSRLNLNAHADRAAAAEIDKWLPGRLIESSRASASWHSPVLMNYRDFGISEPEWIEARENCDINRKWSSAIVERDGKPFAYFCEVAASMDGVRGENHGIEAVPGWWQFGMDRFGHQVTGCCDRGCGVPLKMKGHLDRDDVYDVSQSWASLSVKGKRVQLAVHDSAPSVRVTETTDYMRLRTAEEATA
jgi:hypothetical protein